MEVKLFSSAGAGASEALYVRGLRSNLVQFIQQAIQVFFVGLVIGMERNVVPALAGREFGVAKDSFFFLMSFVLSFGLVKGVLNFVAGRLADRVGRKKVLIAGWLAGLPIPFIIAYAPSWGWIVAANAFLGVNQAFAWTMTVTSKIDIVLPEQRGFGTGVNECAGYGAVGVASIATGYLAAVYGARPTLLAFGVAVIAVALCHALLFVRETLPWVKAERRDQSSAGFSGAQPRFPAHVSEHPSTAEIFTLVSFRHSTFRAFCQAGVTNKIADALIWGLLPVFLWQRGLNVVAIGWVAGTYAVAWGVSQLWTGLLSDRIGRKKPIVAGLWVLAAAVASMIIEQSLIPWLLSSIVMGVGMALLYPNLIAAVADISRPQWRASALGVYRYWRDTGYAVGALVLGVVAQWRASAMSAFAVTAVVLFLSGVWLALDAEETHPGINPQR